MNRDHSDDLAALTAQCEREPLHIPGAIQPAGCLLSVDDTLSRIWQVSANIDRWLGINAQQALGATLSDVLGADPVAQLHRLLSTDADTPVGLTYSRQVTSTGETKRFRLTAYRQQQRIVIELEPLFGVEETSLLPALNAWLGRVAGMEQVDALLTLLTQAVRDLTGHDRVMVYRFDGDWNGTVVAESRSEQASPYLGHSFPSSDIPTQVRRLYLCNPVRSIPDATAAAVPLIPAMDPQLNVPLDLSDGVLRAVSPWHLRYMRNMGVGASLSVAIHDEDRLWGLVACHGLSPGRQSPLVRDAAQALVQVAGQRLFLLQARRETAFLQRVHNCRELITGERDAMLQEPLSLLERQGPRWLALFRACGVAIVHHDKVAGIGALPAQKALLATADWLETHHRSSQAWCSQHLAGTPLAAQLGPGRCCGLLAVPLPVDAERPGWLLLFREEQIRHYRWAGRLEAIRQTQGESVALTPHRSFELWSEKIREHSEPWLALEKQAALDIGEDVAVTILVQAIHALNGRLLRANRQLEDLASTDSLTRAWNRYRIEQALNVRLQAAEQGGQPFALLLLDVDFFKRINDTHGHQAGDRVLTTLAETIGGSLRSTDLLGRWGGEEFMVLGTDCCTADDGLCLAERIRQRVENTDFGEMGPVTVSIGVSLWRPGDNGKQLLERADRALYAAKNAGRNRVVLE
ncbi:sensor domain-containing diguanylate cyclase [Oceanimonas marisflavi]|uniref:sensor domain-containing diguanylate cyclase n=1 Tax=Oceanimonas marisflavi TaxID=2059724 RepID=UPI000D31440C|nr:sensor domain-containing diguanylate cyclase [Oceanimonas marisflavi]